MGLLDIAKSDWQKFSSDTSETGAGVELIFQAKDGAVATVQGLATTHHMATSFDPETGREQKVNVRNVHVSVSEKLFTDALYPVRDVSGRVAMIGHTVRFTNSAEQDLKYSVGEAFPDETIGVIVFILQSVKP